MVIVRSVLRVNVTKSRTYARGNPGELPEQSQDKTGFFPISMLETYMLKAYLKNKRPKERGRKGLHPESHKEPVHQAATNVLPQPSLRGSWSRDGQALASQLVPRPLLLPASPQRAQRAHLGSSPFWGPIEPLLGSQRNHRKSL